MHANHVNGVRLPELHLTKGGLVMKKRNRWRISNLCLCYYHSTLREMVIFVIHTLSMNKDEVLTRFRIYPIGKQKVNLR